MAGFTRAERSRRASVVAAIGSDDWLCGVCHQINRGSRLVCRSCGLKMPPDGNSRLMETFEAAVDPILYARAHDEMVEIRPKCRVPAVDRAELYGAIRDLSREIDEKFKVIFTYNFHVPGVDDDTVIETITELADTNRLAEIKAKVPVCADTIDAVVPARFLPLFGVPSVIPPPEPRAFDEFGVFKPLSSFDVFAQDTMAKAGGLMSRDVLCGIYSELLPSEKRKYSEAAKKSMHEYVAKRTKVREISMIATELSVLDPST